MANNIHLSPMGNQQALLEELIALRDHIRAKDGPLSSYLEQDEQGNDLLAVTRIFRGMSMDQWHELCRTHSIHEWFALPLDKTSQPHLAHLQETLDELAYLTDHDPLTGLANRRAFERTLQMEMQRISRQSSSLALAMIDLDHFKQVNDTYGHQCGDQVLVALADHLKRSKRPYDMVARLGGEEFAFLLPGARLANAVSKMEKLLQQFGRMTFSCADAEDFHVTYSVGVTACKCAGATGEDIIELADKGLYKAKEAGRNRVAIELAPTEVNDTQRTMVHSDEKKLLFGGF